MKYFESTYVELKTAFGTPTEQYMSTHSQVTRVIKRFVSRLYDVNYYICFATPDTLARGSWELALVA
jgi:small-conductance mechanosensitive channel